MKYVKMQLESIECRFGPQPEPDEEIKQRLTILGNGQIWLSHYNYGEPWKNPDHVFVRKEQFCIPSEDAKEILAQIGAYYAAHDPDEATDVGFWDLHLTTADGQEISYYGSLCGGLDSANARLSDLIRSKTKRKDLFLFDGKQDD